MERNSLQETHECQTCMLCSPYKVYGHCDKVTLLLHFLLTDNSHYLKATSVPHQEKIIICQFEWLNKIFLW